MDSRNILCDTAPRGHPIFRLAHSNRVSTMTPCPPNLLTTPAAEIGEKMNFRPVWLPAETRFRLVASFDIAPTNRILFISYFHHLWICWLVFLRIRSFSAGGAISAVDSAYLWFCRLSSAFWTAATLGSGRGLYTVTFGAWNAEILPIIGL